MKVNAINKFGKATEVFESRMIEKPDPESNELLVRVLGSSVNVLDTKIRSGELSFIAPEFPAVLHGDVMGIVEKVGKGVKGFEVGDKVYGFVGGIKGYSGALADYAISDSRFFAQAPKNSSYAESASFPLVSITAYEAVFERASVKPDDKVLIYGGAGGVGHIATQFAKIVGAKVFSVVGSDHQEKIAKMYGADVVINYTHQDVKNYVAQFTEALGFDVIIDTVGLQNFSNSLEAVRPGGTIVNTFAYTTVDISPAQLKGVTLHFIAMLMPLFSNIGKERYGNILTKVASWVEDERVKIHLDEKIFSFQNVGLAHEYFESGKAVGKVALLNEK